MMKKLLTTITVNSGITMSFSDDYHPQVGTITVNSDKFYGGVGSGIGMSSESQYDSRFRDANAIIPESVSTCRKSGASFGEKPMIEFTPDEATDDWIATAEIEKSAETVRNYGTVRNLWTEFTDEQGITSMADVTGADLMRFKRWRVQDDVAMSTVGANLSVLRAFIRHCEQIECVRDGLADKVPEVTTPDGTRDEKIDPDTAEAILDYCEQFWYATRKHVEFALCWETAMRAGAMRAIDVSDCHFDRSNPYIDLVHRPDADTPLKNKEKSERRVNISTGLAELIEDYIARRRKTPSKTVSDREPLLTTNSGRVTYNTIRRDIRGLTRPCVYANECPHDRDPDECEATGGKRNADDCPSTVSCHPVRRGSITHRHLDRDVPKEVISDRCDVSKDVMDRHYDRQDEETKARIRREHLDL